MGGLHRHTPMTMIAYAFLPQKDSSARRPNLPAVRQAILTALAQPLPIRCPTAAEPSPVKTCKSSAKEPSARTVRAQLTFRNFDIRLPYTSQT